MSCLHCRHFELPPGPWTGQGRCQLDPESAVTVSAGDRCEAFGRKPRPAELGRARVVLYAAGALMTLLGIAFAVVMYRLL